MNKSLVGRLAAQQSPFDGATLSLLEPVSLDELIEPLTIVVRELGRRFGDERPSKIHDWHEHDGYMNEEKLSSWPELEALVASSAALATACTGESHVSLGFFPPSYSFYFRIYVIENDEPTFIPTHATFDLTCENEIVALLQNSLESKLHLVCEPAKPFFDKRAR